MYSVFISNVFIAISDHFFVGFMYIYFLRCLFVNSHLLFNNLELQKDMFVTSFYCIQAFLNLYVTKASEKVKTYVSSLCSY